MGEKKPEECDDFELLRELGDATKAGDAEKAGKLAAEMRKRD